MTSKNRRRWVRMQREADAAWRLALLAGLLGFWAIVATFVIRVMT